MKHYLATTTNTASAVATQQKASQQQASGRRTKRRVRKHQIDRTCHNTRDIAMNMSTGKTTGSTAFNMGEGNRSKKKQKAVKYLALGLFGVGLLGLSSDDSILAGFNNSGRAGRALKDRFGYRRFGRNTQRALSVYNPENNTCYWTPTYGPEFIPPDNFSNTVIVGYPGGDKRTVLRQMEAMSTLSGRDAWDFEFLGMTRQPFIKTNYPHHEGIWGWQDHGKGGRVIFVHRGLRRVMDEYHDILADIDYAKTWQEATDKIPNLYHGDIFPENFEAWRNERVMDEIGWYGWVIDYWMEGGIVRDYFNHYITTQDHFWKLRRPEDYPYGALQYEVNVCPNETVPVTYDPRCEFDMTFPSTAEAGCKAALVLSAERLMGGGEVGRAENRKIALFMNETQGIKDYLISEDSWDCLYDNMVVANADGSNTGYGDYRLREGTDDRKHELSTRMLTKMKLQLDRLIANTSHTTKTLALTGLKILKHNTSLSFSKLIAMVPAALQRSSPQLHLLTGRTRHTPIGLFSPRCAMEGTWYTRPTTNLLMGGKLICHQPQKAGARRSPSVSNNIIMSTGSHRASQ